MKKDMESLLTNPIALIVILAVIIIPSLYSLCNIDACWDPYNRTDDMDFIIVNNDISQTINGTTYSYGQEVVNALDNDTNFNWVVKSEDEARNGIKNGDYYAAIIIPSDFTSNILSINTAQPQQGEIEYINNEKINPIAPRITETAVDKIEKEINNQIIKELDTKTYFQIKAINGQAQPQNQTTNQSQEQNTQNVENYFYSPIKTTSYSYYDLDNFGSGIAAFYLTLSQWVGAIITAALLSVKIDKTKIKEKVSSIETYFGKMGIFLIVSICQTLVITIGTFMLSVDIADPLLFIITMFIIGLSTMLIVYSLVSTFGNVGKAIAVIILVVQITGTGGLYPIEVVGTFFQTINPYLPYTYAISALREPLGGIIWANYLTNIGIFLIYPIVTLILTCIIKEKLDKKSKYAEEKLEESGLFA